MSKTYTIAGTATKDGRITWRFASGKAAAREAVLKRTGFTDIKLVDLPSAMTREAAIKHLGTLNITAEMPKTGRKPNPKTVEAAAQELLDAVDEAVQTPVGTEPTVDTVAADDVAFLTSMGTK